MKKRLALRLMVILAMAAVSTASIQDERLPADKLSSDDLVEETQLSIRGEENMGVIWWMPVEFWMAGGGFTSQQLEPLRDYTMIAVMVGRTGPFGVSFIPPQKVKSSVILRDMAGKDHLPLEKVGNEAEMLTQIMKPLFTNLLGQMGSNIEMIFFPGKGKDGKPLIDPAVKGSFSVVLKDLVEPGDSVYTFELPLDSLFVPKVCPQGKEQVKRKWNYCPWHGNKLN